MFILNPSLWIDVALVTGFGLQHSVLATLRVKSTLKRRWGMTPLAWRSVESVSNIVYVLFATALWRRSDIVIWNIDGPIRYALLSGLAASWLWYWYLHLVEYDSGLAFGSTTLVARLADAVQPQLENWTVGSRRWIRFPVHTAFFGMFLLLPRMTADLLVLGIVLNIYNVIGSILYDKRLIKTIPSMWNPYIEKTGLIWPPVYRCPAGATAMGWPSPRQWRKPAMHLPGAIVGLALGALYYCVLGAQPWGPADMIRVFGVSILAALVSGAVLAYVAQTDAESWGQRQTDLSTSVALSSAVGVVCWVAASLLLTGSAPTFGVYLPMWFTVQYLGHVVAYAAHPSRWSVDAREVVAAQ